LDIDGFEENPSKIEELVCTKCFVKVRVIRTPEELSSVKFFAAPYRGMVPVIPSNPPVAVFEPGTLFHRCSSQFFEEVQWDLTGEWHGFGNICCEWLFPSLYVFHRDGLPRGKHEKKAIEDHVKALKQTIINERYFSLFLTE